MLYVLRISITVQILWGLRLYNVNKQTCTGKAINK